MPRLQLHPQMRAVRARPGARSCSCASQAAWRTLNIGPKPKSYPPLNYSINRQDVRAVDLGLLLSICGSETTTSPDTGSSTPLGHQNFGYWRSELGLRHAAKLELALRRSVAVVACFTTWDVYGSSYGDYDSASYEHTMAAAMHGNDEGDRDCPTLGLGPSECTSAGGSRWAADGPMARGSTASDSSSRASSSASYTDSGRVVQPPPTGTSKSAARMAKGIPDMDWNWLRPASQPPPQPPHDAPTSRREPTTPPSSSSSAGSSSSSIATRPAAPTTHHSGPVGGGSPPPVLPGGRRCLVGFARATGDMSLVATIYDVAVHPAVRGYGIGQRLVNLLVQQLQARSVYDIGAVTPPGAAGFWGRCGFDNDREGSTFMMFVGSGGSGGRGGGGGGNESQLEHDLDEHLQYEGRIGGGGTSHAWPRTSQELLSARDLDHWKAAQQSTALREMVAEKLERARRGKWK